MEKEKWSKWYRILESRPPLECCLHWLILPSLGGYIHMVHSGFQGPLQYTANNQLVVIVMCTYTKECWLRSPRSFISHHTLDNWRQPMTSALPYSLYLISLFMKLLCKKYHPLSFNNANSFWENTHQGNVWCLITGNHYLL